MATSLVSINSMTDFDRGLEQLNHHLHREEGVSQPNIVKELLDIDTHIEERKKEELGISQRRWILPRSLRWVNDCLLHWRSADSSLYRPASDHT